jgi:hypothetical protein
MDVRLFLRVILCSGLLLSACSDESSPQKPSNTDSGADDDGETEEDEDNTGTVRDAGRDAGRTRDAGRDAGRDSGRDDDEEDAGATVDEEDAGAIDGDTGPIVDGAERADASIGVPVPAPSPITPEPGGEAAACAEVAKLAQPIIADKCTGACHAANSQTKAIPLATIDQITSSADRIAALVVGPQMGTPQMPPTGPLPVAWMSCLQR